MTIAFKQLFLKGARVVLAPFLTLTLFSGCFYLNIDGSNDFHRMAENMVESSYDKLKVNLQGEVVFVSDFVNVNNVRNRTKLGFLQSEVLKDVLSNKDIIVREVELGLNFKIGESGFNVLSREHSEIDENVYNEKYALVGTYSITTKRLWIFIKLIDIYTGEILASSTESTILTDEIRELEKDLNANKNKYIYKPMVL